MFFIEQQKLVTWLILLNRNFLAGSAAKLNVVHTSQDSQSTEIGRSE